ncbi:MAG TPA: type II toxin-antitoxin system VapC family toxin, partial [Thermoanaerobaculia bacterium]|nr:type II toxin-antitoxin system VapC family toxin [Thermoanaerobaculia bacterium]
MRYWDASAIIPLVVAEPSSAEVRGWLEEDPAIVTWAWTRVELINAVERRARQGELTREHRRNCLDRFEALAAAWDEVSDLFSVRARAIPLLARHALRAADAAQLGAALLVAEGNPASLQFVCLDERLARTAELEGLQLL